MLFNSLQFAVFFPVVTLLYFLSPQRLRVPLLLVSSCVFYMAFIPKYILILAFLILVDYAAGIVIENAHGRRRHTFLIVSLCANIGILGFFKYFNFFNDNLAAVARALDWNYSIQHLRIILPIGLSFHTFQSMSYTIEVYRGRVPAERSLPHFALYVLFYPQLVAGPNVTLRVERTARHRARRRRTYRHGSGRNAAIRRISVTKLATFIGEMHPSVP